MSVTEIERCIAALGSDEPLCQEAANSLLIFRRLDAALLLVGFAASKGYAFTVDD